MTNDPSQDCKFQQKSHQYRQTDDSQDIGAVFDLFQPPGSHREYEFYFGGLPEIHLRGGIVKDFPAAGMALWRGSEVLSDYLVKHPILVKNKTVLELGAGLGLCGIVAHYLGASSVLITDGDEDVVENMQFNVEHNVVPTNENKGNRIHCSVLLWDCHVDDFLLKHGCQDVVLAGDCVYASTSLEPIWKTIQSLLSEKGVFIYANLCSSQVPLEQVLEVASKHGFTVTSQEFSRAPVHLFRRAVTN
jgi:hypothetical protein